MKCDYFKFKVRTGVRTQYCAHLNLDVHANQKTFATHTLTFLLYLFFEGLLHISSVAYTLITSYAYQVFITVMGLSFTVLQSLKTYCLILRTYTGNLRIFNRNGMYTLQMIVQLHTICMNGLSTSPELLDQVLKSMPYKRLSTFYQAFIFALRQEVVENLATDDSVKATRAFDQSRWDLSKLTENSLTIVAQDLVSDIKLIPQQFFTLNYYTAHQCDTEFKQLLDNLKADFVWFCAHKNDRPETFWPLVFAKRPAVISDQLKALVEKALVIGLGSADAERVFSLMNLGMPSVLLFHIAEST